MPRSFNWQNTLHYISQVQVLLENFNAVLVDLTVYPSIAFAQWKLFERDSAVNINEILQYVAQKPDDWYCENELATPVYLLIEQSKAFGLCVDNAINGSNDQRVIANFSFLITKYLMQAYNVLQLSKLRYCGEGVPQG